MIKGETIYLFHHLKSRCLAAEQVENQRFAL